jgi:hypothetical protein
MASAHQSADRLTGGRTSQRKTGTPRSLAILSALGTVRNRWLCPACLSRLAMTLCQGL